MSTDLRATYGFEAIPREDLGKVKRIIEKKGRPALERARGVVLGKKYECAEVRRALAYFMSYWHDVTRPALISSAIEAVGGNAAATLPISTSLILTSGAMDIHDDIIDETMSKGRRRTVLGRFGKDIALLVGDALLFDGLALLSNVMRKIEPRKADLLMSVLRRRFFELGEAEAMELRFRGRTDVTPSEYLGVVEKKAADVEAYTHVGAIMGNGSSAEVRALANYGRSLGMMIILRDDLADMLEFKTELPQRIMKESMPLPIVYALQTSSKRHIESILRRRTIGERDSKLLFQATASSGGLQELVRIERTLAMRGIRSLRKLAGNTSTLELMLRATVPSV